MSKRIRIVAIAVLWALSLVAVGTWVRAQEMMLQQPLLYAGDDLGVRVTTTPGEQSQATLVIRINGRWQEVELKPARR